MDAENAVNQKPALTVAVLTGWLDKEIETMNEAKDKSETAAKVAVTVDQNVGMALDFATRLREHVQQFA